MDKVTLFDYFKYLKPEHDIEGVFLAVIIVLSFGTALWVWHSTRERKGKKLLGTTLDQQYSKHL